MHRGLPPPVRAVHQQNIDLGNALQLTDIVPDVAEDAHRGRVCPPKEDLARFGVDESEFTAATIGLPSRNMVRLLRFEADRARIIAACVAVGEVNKRLLVVAEVDSYHAILDQSDFDVFRVKQTIRRSRKMPIAVPSFAGAEPGRLVRPIS